MACGDGCTRICVVDVTVTVSTFMVTMCTDRTVGGLKHNHEGRKDAQQKLYHQDLVWEGACWISEINNVKKRFPALVLLYKIDWELFVSNRACAVLRFGYFFYLRGTFETQMDTRWTMSMNLRRNRTSVPSPGIQKYMGPNSSREPGSRARCARARSSYPQTASAT